MRRVFRGLSAAGVGLTGALLFARAAFAQGCALCYNDAAATGPQAQAALRHGILVLAIPPMLIFAAMFGILYRRRNLDREAVLPAATPNPARSVSQIILHLS